MSIQQAGYLLKGTLAEWLTRWPATGVPPDQASPFGGESSNLSGGEFITARIHPTKSNVAISRDLTLSIRCFLFFYFIHHHHLLFVLFVRFCSRTEQHYLGIGLLYLYGPCMATTMAIEVPKFCNSMTKLRDHPAEETINYTCHTHLNHPSTT